MYIWHLQHKTTGGVEAIYAENQDKVGQFPRSQLRAESSLVARKNARFGLWSNNPHLTRNDDEQGNEEGHPLPVEDLDHVDYADGQKAPCPGIGEDGDEDVLLDIEGPGIQRELVWGGLEEDSIGDGGSHEVAQRHHLDLGGRGMGSYL